MVEQPKATFPQEQGQAPDLDEGQGGQAQPETLTRQEIQALLQEQENRFVERTKGLLNSISDKTQNKVQTALAEFQRSIEVQKAAGIELSPEQMKAAQQQVIMDAISKPEEQETLSGTEATSAAQQTQQPTTADPITQEAWKMMEDNGVDILEQDEEYKSLDFTSPYRFLKSVEQAIEAKKLRLGNTSNAEQENKNAFTRIPGAGAGGTGSSLMPEGTPAIDRLNQFYRKAGTK